MSSYLGNDIPYLYNSGVQNSKRLKYTPPNVNIVYVQDQKLAYKFYSDLLKNDKIAVDNDIKIMTNITNNRKRVGSEEVLNCNTYVDETCKNDGILCMIPAALNCVFRGGKF